MKMVAVVAVPVAAKNTTATIKIAHSTRLSRFFVAVVAVLLTSRQISKS